MFSLLYKDIVLYLKQCGLIFAGILLFSSSLLIVPAEEEMTDSKGLIMLLLCVYHVITFFLIGMLEQGIYEKDENQKWQMFLSSTPLLYQGQILSKYIETLILSATAVLWSLFYERLVLLKYDIHFSTIKVCLMLFAIQIIFRAIEMPIIILLGSKYGSKCRALVSGIVLFVVFVYLLFGNIDFFVKEESILKFIVKLLDGDKKTMLTRVSSILFCTGGVAYALSCIVALRLWKKR